MQHHLPHNFESAWDLADMVSTHGQHDFRRAEGSLRSVASLCGLTVYYHNRQPVRLAATDLDVTLERLELNVVPVFEDGAGGMQAACRMLNARYALHFRKGDAAALRAWQGRLAQFGERRAA